MATTFLTNEEIHLKMLMGQNIFIEGIGEFKVPLVKEISEMTETRFNTLTTALLFNKNAVKAQELFDELTEFQLLSIILLVNSDFRKLFLESLELYIQEKPQFDELTGTVFFHQLTEATVLDEEKFNYIKKLVMIANNYSLKQEEQIEAGNERARKFMEKLAKQKAELSKYKKQKISLQSIVSAVAWRSHSILDIPNLTIYQLFDGYKRLSYIDNYDKTMTAAYSGMVDTKKMNLKDLNWANIIKED